MHTRRISTLAVSLTFGVLATSCVTPAPQTPPKVSHTITTAPLRACGPLDVFVENVTRLDSSAMEALRNELGSYDQNGFSCDQLKTGLLLGQAGVSISDDNLAIEILENYRESDQLQADERRLVDLLLYQSRERKELHVQVHNQRQKIRRQEEALLEVQSQATSRADEISALEHKLEELKKLEADINATEQSLSTPATTGIEDAQPSNTGS